MTVKRYGFEGMWVLHSDFQTLATENGRVRELNQKLVAENARMREIIDAVTDLDNEPQYHEIGMGCGLEDRGITDRYEAMRHGWDAAMERVYGEVIPCDEELEFKATDAAIAEIKAQGVDDFVKYVADMHSKTEIGSRLEFNLAFTGDTALLFATHLRAGRKG